jgi:hypothetical protein
MNLGFTLSIGVLNHAGASGAPAPAALTTAQFSAAESGVDPGKIVVTVIAGTAVPEGWRIKLYVGSSPAQTDAALFVAGATLSPGVAYTTASTFPAGSTRYARLAWERIADGTIHSLSEVRSVNLAAVGGVSIDPIVLRFGAAA